MKEEMANINRKVEARVRYKSQWIKKKYDDVQKKSEELVARKLNVDDEIVS